MLDVRKTFITFNAKEYSDNGTFKMNITKQFEDRILARIATIIDLEQDELEYNDRRFKCYGVIIEEISEKDITVADVRCNIPYVDMILEQAEENMEKVALVSRNWYNNYEPWIDRGVLIRPRN